MTLTILFGKINSIDMNLYDIKKKALVETIISIILFNRYIIMLYLSPLLKVIVTSQTILLVFDKISYNTYSQR